METTRLYTAIMNEALDEIEGCVNHSTPFPLLTVEKTIDKVRADLEKVDKVLTLPLIKSIDLIIDRMGSNPIIRITIVTEDDQWRVFKTILDAKEIAPLKSINYIGLALNACPYIMKHVYIHEENQLMKGFTTFGRDDAFNSGALPSFQDKITGDPLDVIIKGLENIGFEKTWYNDAGILISMSFKRKVL